MLPFVFTNYLSLHDNANESLFIIRAAGKTYRNNNSQGLMPVCFLNAVLKCEMEE